MSYQITLATPKEFFSFSCNNLKAANLLYDSLIKTNFEIINISIYEVSEILDVEVDKEEIVKN